MSKTIREEIIDIILQEFSVTTLSVEFLAKLDALILNEMIGDDATFGDTFPKLWTERMKKDFVHHQNFVKRKIRKTYKG